MNAALEILVVLLVLNGKALAQRIIPELESETEPKLKHDSSTNNLVRRYPELRRKL